MTLFKLRRKYEISKMKNKIIQIAYDTLTVSMSSVHLCRYIYVLSLDISYKSKSDKQHIY